MFVLVAAVSRVIHQLVITSGGVFTNNVAAVTPDHGLESGGLLPRSD